MRVLASAVLVVLALGAPAVASDGPSGWLTYGGDPARSSATGPVSAAALAGGWTLPLDGRVVGQALVARNVPAAGALTVYSATEGGSVYAVAANGYIRWRVELGQLALAHPCPQMDGWGVTGTPVADPAAGALYVADAFGLLHALDLADGSEREGWPVRVVSGFAREHVWGALALVHGSVYVPTASICDRPSEGELVRVELATRKVSRWIAVPMRLGGGGGVWGFGGAAYSAARDSLLVATGNAFGTGPRHEAAGHGEQLVELSPQLRVRGASHPRDVRAPLDLDFGSGVVVAKPAGCGELALATNKNGTLYAWRTGGIGAGPAWSISLRPLALGAALVGQPAWASAVRSVFVATSGALVRVGVTSACRPRIVWRAPLPHAYVQGSPTVAGGLVWLSVAGREGLVGFDLRSGARRFHVLLDGDAFAAPAVLDGSLFAGTFAAALHGFPARAYASDDAAPRLAEQRQPGWEAREDGVYARDVRVLELPAFRIVSVSARDALVVVPGGRACGCRWRMLWTDDGGATWAPGSLPGRLVAAGGDKVYATDGATLSELSWPPLEEPRAVGHVGGTIVALAGIPDGVVALASRRRRGIHWDERPQLLVRHADGTDVFTLPRVRGGILARSVEADWPRLTVRGVDYLAGASRPRRVVWRSADGGRTWQVELSGPAPPGSDVPSA